MSRSESRPSTWRGRPSATGLAEAGILVYKIAATNPLARWAWGYCKANQGINDVILFDIVDDQVLTEHREEWRPRCTGASGLLFNAGGLACPRGRHRCESRRPWR